MGNSTRHQPQNQYPSISFLSLQPSLSRLNAAIPQVGNVPFRGAGGVQNVAYAGRDRRRTHGPVEVPKARHGEWPHGWKACNLWFSGSRMQNRSDGIQAIPWRRPVRNPVRNRQGFGRAFGVRRNPTRLDVKLNQRRYLSPQCAPRASLAADEPSQAG